MTKIEQSVIDQAASADLAVYLLSIGHPLAQSGNRHRHKEHDSLIFTRNMYFWNSRGENGNGINYLTRHLGMTFAEAVATLSGVAAAAPSAPTAPAAAMEKAKDCRRVVAYLCKSRCIDYEIVKQLVEAGLLYQAVGTNNAVFQTYNEQGECVGAEMEGTLSEKRFKGIQAGSAFGYGFNIRFPSEANNSPATILHPAYFGSRYAGHTYALFFESAIDVLSYIDLRTKQGKTFDNCILISMGGLKVSVVYHMLEKFRGQPILCVDNDNAGREFIRNIKQGDFKVQIRFPEAPHKDWNDQLRHERKPN